MQHQLGGWGSENDQLVDLPQQVKLRLASITFLCPRGVTKVTAKLLKGRDESKYSPQYLTHP